MPFTTELTVDELNVIREALTMMVGANNFTISSLHATTDEKNVAFKERQVARHLLNDVLQ